MIIGLRYVIHKKYRVLSKRWPRRFNLIQSRRCFLTALKTFFAQSRRSIHNYFMKIFLPEKEAQDAETVRRTRDRQNARVRESYIKLILKPQRIRSSTRRLSPAWYSPIIRKLLFLSLCRDRGL